MKRILILAVGLASLLGAASSARAEDQQARIVKDTSPKAQAKAWFEGMGIDTTDGFAKDVFNLITGIDQRVSPSTNFTVSAGNGFRMGFNWK